MGLTPEERTEYFKILRREQEILLTLHELKQQLAASQAPPPPPPPAPPQEGRAEARALDPAFCKKYAQMLLEEIPSMSRSTMEKFALHAMAHGEQHREIVRCLERRLAECPGKSTRLATWYVYDAILKRSYEQQHHRLLTAAHRRLPQWVEAHMDWQDPMYGPKYQKIVAKWRRMLPPSLMATLEAIARRAAPAPMNEEEEEALA